jgi:serine protease Do/serine protease DegQ
MARFTLIKTTAIAAGAALLATAATIALTTTSPVPARAEVPAPVIAQAPTTGNGVPSLAPLVKSLLPGVVNIRVSSKVEIQNPLLADPFFRRFFNVPDQPQTQEMQAIGSGVIIDADKGYIITNNHVVEKADKVKVRLNDDREFDAKVVGTDPETDVAMLQIKAPKLTAIKLGDSDALQVGDFVLAIGSPFNLRGTVTSGIVSALGRATGEGGGIQDFIQTDASINPGNSGGALVNLKGELVGINSQILSGSGGSIGIGFAIPINLVKSVTTQLIASGKVERGRIGIVGQPLTPDLAKEFGLKDGHGALVAQVVPGSPADKAGIKVADIIVEANGKPIETFEQLRNIVGLLHIGDEVKLKLLRDGNEKDVTVNVGKSTESAPSGKSLYPALEGAAFVPFSGGDDGTPGVQVQNIQPGSPAAETGLQPGDVIVSVNKHPIKSMDDFRKYAGVKEGNLLLQVRRGNGAFFLLLQP